MARKKRNNQGGGKVTRHANRNTDKHTSRCDKGMRDIAEDQRVNNESYTLDWFNPTKGQQEVVRSMIENDLTLVQASSGAGKSTTVIWQALKDLKAGYYKKILFVKTPNESSDDLIGFLPSSAEDKLQVHFEATRSVFHQFMTKEKLAMEEKKGRISFKIPNFIQGATFENTLMILDESQSLSPNTMKLVMERVGQGSKIVVCADKRQRYSYRKREDGFTNFVNMVTAVDEDGRYSNVDTIGYVEMPASANMRSDLSRLIVTLYEEDAD